jgi:hypothetical protein
LYRRVGYRPVASKLNGDFFQSRLLLGSKDLIDRFLIRLSRSFHFGAGTHSLTAAPSLTSARATITTGSTAAGPTAVLEGRAHFLAHALIKLIYLGLLVRR